MKYSSHVGSRNPWQGDGRQGSPCCTGDTVSCGRRRGKAEFNTLLPGPRQELAARHGPLESVWAGCVLPPETLQKLTLFPDFSFFSLRQRLTKMFKAKHCYIKPGSDSWWFCQSRRRLLERGASLRRVTIINNLRSKGGPPDAWGGGRGPEVWGEPGSNSANAIL